MRRLLMLAVSLACLTEVAQADLLCSYTARISDQDKFSSTGASLVQNDKATAATAAAIIRQDRANYHQFNKRDSEDETDCVFDDKEKRALLEKRLAAGKTTKEALNKIVFGNPLLTVDVYDNYVDISIQKEESAEEAPPPRRSSMK